jgi:[ribosomal protein S5]-alanine N-acetyltransferase
MITGASAQPTLSSLRFDLRPFTLADAPAVQTLAGAREVAATTLSIPHPYEDGLAEEWIRTHAPGFAAGVLMNWAIVERSTRRLLGAIGLNIQAAHERAELGYWIGVPFWNRGYATDASAVLLEFGFGELRLNRIHAHFFARNPASGRVLQKLGMEHEGRLRQHIRKWGVFEDIEMYGILRSEWRLRNPGAEPR